MAVIFGNIGDGEGGDDRPSGALRTMQAALAYAMPHGATLRHGPGWGMGQARSAAESPVDDKGGLNAAAFVADALVGNAAELATRLGLVGPVSSASAIAAAYARWGEGLGSHVVGAWTMAAFDPQARALTIVRDPLGLRPMYVARGRGWMAFSSEVEGLSALPGVGSALDPVGIASAWFDEIGWANPEATALRDVRAVPAGHVWRLRVGEEPRSRRYWRLEPLPALAFDHADVAVEAFREVFGDAVEAMLRESVQPGLMLSGGIDSAAVLAAANGFSARAVTRVRCISAVTSDTVFGLEAEMANIRRLLDGQGDAITLQVPPPSRQGGSDAADAAEVAWGYHHPRDASALVPGLVYRAASAAGVDVVLDGIDGDLVTAPIEDPVASRFAGGQWRTAWQEASAASQVNPYQRGVRPWRIAMKGLASALVPDWARRVRERLGIPSQVSRSGLAQGLLVSAQVEERLRSAYAALPNDRDARHATLLAHRLSNSLCSMRHVAMRRGIDARHPWGYLPLVEFMQRLPTAWRARDGWTKYLVRLSCAGALGHDVAWHSGKSHVGVALTATLAGDAAPYLLALVTEHRTAVEQVIDPRTVDAALACLQAPHACDDHDTALQVSAMAGWLTARD